MGKKVWVILLPAVALYVGLAIWLNTEVKKAEEERDYAYQLVKVAQGERDNEKESARQWKTMYDMSLTEIAELKGENEALTAQVEELTVEVEDYRSRYEEVSFALDEVVSETGWESLGTFTATWYCPCEKCCGKYSSGYTATGTLATEGRTVAVDPKVIPLGSKLRINGHIYIAEDTGVSGRVIDIFVSSHEKALQYGVKKVEVERKTT